MIDLTDAGLCPVLKREWRVSILRARIRNMSIRSHRAAANFKCAMNVSRSSKIATGKPGDSWQCATVLGIGPLQMPKRIQWRRGVIESRMSPDAKLLTRNSRWGNPFVVLPYLEAGSKIKIQQFMCVAVPTVEDTIACYWRYMKARLDLMEMARRELKGHDLACSCKLDEECHADILLSIANA